MENSTTPITRTWRQFIESKAYTIFEHVESSTKYSVLITLACCDLFQSEKAQVDILDKSNGQKVSVKEFMGSKDFTKINRALSYIDWTLIGICFDPSNEDEWDLFPATLDLNITSLSDKDAVDKVIKNVSEELSLKNFYDAVKEGTYGL